MSPEEALAAALHEHSIVANGVNDDGERWFGCICGETLRGADRASTLFGPHLSAALADSGYTIVRSDELARLREAASTLCHFAGRFSAGDIDIDRSDVQVAIDDLRAALEDRS